MDNNSVTDVLLDQLTDGESENQSPEPESPPVEEPASQANESGPEQDSEEPEGEQPEDGESHEEESKPVTLKQLAEALEVEPSAIYDVELGDGLTIGNLKDRFKDLQGIEALRADAEAFKTDSENELIRKRRELAVAQQNLGREPTAQEQREAQQAYESYVERETAETMRSIPDWREPSVLEGDREGMKGLLNENGISDVEFAQIADHRMVKFIRDAYKLKDRVANAGTEVKPGKSKRGTKRKARVNGTDKILSDFNSGKLKQNDAATALLLGLKQ